MPPTLSLDFADFLPAWVARQRWYTGKGRTPQLTRIGGLRWQDPAGEVGIDLWLVRDDSGTEPVVYQVPLTYRGAAAEELHTALIATAQHSELGTRYIYDGAADPVFVQALLSTIATGEALHDDGSEVAGTPVSVTGHPIDPDAEPPEVIRSAVLTGEQSNTSVIVEVGRSAPIIIKLFRVLQTGSNPDVEVQSALATAGNDEVPRPVGHLSGTWPDLESDDNPHEPAAALAGDLAFAQEFLPGAEDAWRVATRSAATRGRFADEAREMGAATAAVHTSLRDAFPVVAVTDAERDRLTAHLMRRLDHAIEAEPSLADHRQAAEVVYRRAADAARWPDLQRIHGDLHLGQILDSDRPARSNSGPQRWVFVDFEGEPLRPLAERFAPDLAWRDVAGMLRSFDYAAATVELEEAEASTFARSWAEDCRTEYLEGYQAVAGTRLTIEDQHLLDALELDKALYEVVYETRNRPGWVSIPTRAVHRLLSSHNSAVDSAETPSTDESAIPVPPTEPATETGQATSAGDARTGPAEDGRSPERKPLSGVDAERLVRGVHAQPHAILGAHPYGDGVTIRALRPMAQAVTVLLPGDRRVEMQHETHGIFTAVIPDSEVPDYRIEARWDEGFPEVRDEPYRYLPTVGEMDLHLINEGRHEHLWQVLGANLREYDGPMGQVRGVAFAVWAPHAGAVQVVGDFNGWDSAAHPMRALGTSGVWEIFVPGVPEGSKYKFRVVGRDGHARLKADPMARAAEVPPDNASVVTQSHYDWSDGEWLAARASNDPHLGPMSIYEVHLGSWRQGLSYIDLADQLVGYVRAAGFTHVELMPVMQHPYAPSWGYHVTGYYAADSRFGSPDELRFLIDRLHQAGIGVILDWVPGHFATDPWALAQFDGTALYEHPDPRRGWHPEWGSYIFDFGKPQVRNFLVANALYWIEEFHADGLRVDGVASMLYLDYARNDGEWLPNQYGGRENLDAVRLLQETNATLYRRNPGAVTIAEESTSWPGVTARTDEGGLGFGFKWNMGWMHDSLEYVSRQPIHRQYHHHQLTFSLMYAFSEHFVLPISHDEVVHGKGSLVRKMAGDTWQRLANLRAYLAFMWAHPGKQLLFMGSEFAQVSEWADGRSLDWWLLEQPQHAGVLRMVRDLNSTYRDTRALWEGDHHSAGFQWLNADDAQGNTFSFVRYGNSTEDAAARGLPDRPSLVAVANFGGAPRTQVPLGLPHGGRWREVMNTDAEIYGGSGVGNYGAVSAEPIPHHGQPYSARVTLPPLGVLWLTPDPDSDTAGDSGSPNEPKDDS